MAVSLSVDRQVSYFHFFFFTFSCEYIHNCNTRLWIAFECILIMFYLNRLNPSETLLWSQSLENLLRSKCKWHIHSYNSYINVLILTHLTLCHVCEFYIFTRSFYHSIHDQLFSFVDLIDVM